MPLLESVLSEQILAAFYYVYRALGFGFLESVYCNALCVQLQRSGLKVEREVPIEVVFEGVVVGRFRADILVNDRIMIEVKATKFLTDADDKQLMNYLKGTRIEIGYILHFGPTPQFRRKVFTNDRKGAVATV
ncbi:MAG TPA: GxxExxY protein [Gemmatimonadaceae bacterium]|nr:GxxExxY protein [Gemmatimonadaceae bacterium]